MGIHIANVWHLDLCLSYPNVMRHLNQL